MASLLCDSAAGRNEVVSVERRMENGFLSHHFSGTNVSCGQTMQNGCQNPVNPFVHSIQSNGFSSAAMNPFLPRGTEICLRNDYENGNILTQILTSQSNGWAHFPATSAASYERDWAALLSPNSDGKTNQTSSRVTQSSNTHSTDLSCINFSGVSLSSQKSDDSLSSGNKDNLLEYILARQKRMSRQNSEEASNWLSTDVSLSSLSLSERNSDRISSPELQGREITGNSVQNASLQNNSLFQTPISNNGVVTTVSDVSSIWNDPFKPQEQNLNKPVSPTELFPSSTIEPINSPTHGAQSLNRLPPKPAPRTRLLKSPDQSHNGPAPLSPVTPPALTHSPPVTPAPPTSVSPAKSNKQNTAPLEKDNDVYEDILYIGQEICVENWPEDSPMLSPDWKPSGKLKLRRDSLRITTEQDGAISTGTRRKKSIKIKRPSILSRKFSKDSSPELNGVFSDPSTWETNVVHDNVLEDDVFDKTELSGTVKKNSVKKRKPKLIVPQLTYRGSRKTSLTEDPDSGSQDSLPDEQNEEKMRKSGKKDLNNSKLKESLKFTMTLPRRKSKDTFEDDAKNGYAFVEEAKENPFLNADSDKSHTSNASPVGCQEEVSSQKTFKPPSPIDNAGKGEGTRDCRPKKTSKFVVPHLTRSRSKCTEDKTIPRWKDDETRKACDLKASKLDIPEECCQDVKDLSAAEKGADLFKAGDAADAENQKGKPNVNVKRQRFKKLHKFSKDSKAKDQECFPEDFEAPGATAGNFYFSEAAKAEWMSSQMDVRRAKEPDDEGLEGVEEEEEGDTDSLMEWWNNVELWDEVPSDEEIDSKEDETKSFTEIADKVHRGVRVFFKTFTEQAEVLYQHVLFLFAIGDDISNFHRRTKIANITGSTTTAVGGVAAIAGLALAPVTMGASIIVSAVGLGVATAGGITAASAAISDNLHDMTDRKKIEVVVQDFETRLLDLRHSLKFVAEGVRRLRCHPLLRRNNYYAGDWEVRRALQTTSMVGEPVEKGVEIVDSAVAALNSVCTGIDKFFSKDSKELKKGCKKEVTKQVHLLAKLLQDSLVSLNAIREQLMDATGHVLFC